MNRRVATRFAQPEVLQIFGDVCEAVAFLHYQKPNPIMYVPITQYRRLIL
jgi:AP2-associated kinase